MIEHELRFALTPSMIAEFEQRATLGLARPSVRLQSRYFDTAAGDLMKAAVSLRVRSTPEGFVQTVDAAGSGAVERCEWEVPVSTDEPVFDALPPDDHPAGALARDYFGLLAPVFEADFERQLRLVRPQPGVTVELACDRGELRAGARSERIAEVHLERKEGPAAAFYHYAMQWARLHEARLVLRSKSTRGRQLAGLQPEQARPVAAQPVSPSAQLPIAEAARRILAGHLQHFLANVAAVGSSCDAQGPHQWQVALRRWRAAIGFLGLRGRDAGVEGGPAGNDVAETWRELDRRARALARAAAFVRSADRFEAGLLARLDQALPGDPAIRLLVRSLAVERERERARLRAVSDSRDLAAFVLQALAAIESLPPDRWQRPGFGEFAAPRLRALARRLRRRTRRAQTRAQWRAVSTAIGALRHALESCGELAATSIPVGDPTAALSRWQSSLGLERDLAVARGIAARALAGSTAPVEIKVRAAALVDGYRTGATGRRRPEERRRAILALTRQLLSKPPRRQVGRRDGERAPAPEAAAGSGPSAPASAPGVPQWPGAESRSGYHSGTPGMPAPDAHESFETWKEEPE